MAAMATHVSTKLVLTLDAGTEGGKKITKRVTISGLRGGISGDAILKVAGAVEKLLEYPVASIEIHTVSAIERRGENEASREAAAADGSQPGGQPAALAFRSVMPAKAPFPRLSDNADDVSCPGLPRQSAIFSYRAMTHAPRPGGLKNCARASGSPPRSLFLQPGVRFFNLCKRSEKDVYCYRSVAAPRRGRIPT